LRAAVEDDQDAGGEGEAVEVAVELAAAVDQAVQAGHEDDLAGGFMVALLLDEDLAVLAPEHDELLQQAGQVEPAVGEHEAVRVGVDVLLRQVAQHAQDDLPVDRVGHLRRRFLGDQSQIAGVGQVVGVAAVGVGAAGHDRFHHSLDPGFVQPGRQGAQMGGACPCVLFPARQAGAQEPARQQALP